MSILQASYGTVGDIEILWTLIALIGVLFSLYNVKNARTDVKAVKGLPANGRGLIAKAQLAVESIRIGVQAFFLSIGIYVMFLPQPPTDVQPLHITIFQSLFTWGMILSSVGLTVQSIVNSYVRRRLI